MISEPTGDSIYSPKTRSNRPMDDFPWSFLEDVSIAILWLPANQKLLWQRAAQQHGLSSFRLYTPSESSEVEIKPPPRPKREYTEAERQAAHQRYTRYVKYVLAAIGAFVFVLICLLVIAGILMRRRRRLISQNSGNSSLNNRGHRLASRNSTR